LNNKIKTAFIGCGVHATRDLFPLLSKIPAISLVAVCDLDKTRSSKNAKRFGSKRYYTDYKRMVEKEKIDAAIIVGPPTMHFVVGAYFIERRIPIFLEKPITTGLNSAKKLVTLGKKHSKFVQVGYFLRHAKANRLAKEIIESKEFGNPVSFYGTYFTNSPWEPRKAWGLDNLDWTYMLVQGIHLIDLTRYFFGELVSVRAKKYTFKNNRFSFVVNATFQLGTIGILNLSNMTAKWHTALEIVGENGGIVNLKDVMRLSYERASVPSKNKSNTSNIYLQDSDNNSTKLKKIDFGYLSELEHFIESVINNHEPSPDLHDAYKSMLIAEAIIKSCELEKTIIIK